ncbi:MAG TPA: hypothetical protein VGF46_06545, partial [Gaiellales bacterium]
ELLNRIDEVIVFHKLAKEEIGVIVDLMMRRLREQMKEHEVSIELSQDAVELLAEKGYDPAMGARPLRRTIQNLIEDPLADFVLSRSLPAGATIVIGRKFGVDDEGNPKKLDEVDLEVVPAAASPEPEPAAVGGGSSDGDADDSKPED